jgi:hypothetical protein
VGEDRQERTTEKHSTSGYCKRNIKKRSRVESTGFEGVTIWSKGFLLGKLKRSLKEGEGGPSAVWDKHKGLEGGKELELSAEEQGG